MTQFKKLGILTAIIVTPAILNFAFIEAPTASELNELTTYKYPAVIQPNEIALETEISIFKLWEDDITLSNNAILCFLEADLYAQESLTELCANKSKLNLFIQSNYGKNTRTKFSQLLETRIMITFDLAIAQKNQNESMITTSTKNWITSNDEISQLIEKSEMTKRLSEMKMEMNDHSKNSDVTIHSNPKYKFEEPVIIKDLFVQDTFPKIVSSDTIHAYKQIDTSSTRFEDHKFKIVVKKIPAI